MSRALTAWFEGQRVGVFGQSEDGRQSFAYEQSWVADPQSFPLSLSMPLGGGPFDDLVTRAFFGGLLPDDELRRRLARYLQVSARNEFALLAEVGRECAGAIVLLPPDQQPPARTGGVRVLAEAELTTLLADLPARPLWVGGEVRLSLAGAQDKVAVCLEDGEIALPTDGGPTTHILKTPIEGYQETVANECFCMQVAGAVGLPVPPVERRRIGETEVLLVERFDRARDGDSLRRLHQEDFCQAMAVPPDLKYQAEGGPGFAEMFGLLAAHSNRAAVDRLRLLDMALFHFLVGNADAHGKNYSLLLGPGVVRLAPVYDAMCTLVYPELSPRMAMKIGSKRGFDEVRAEHWEAFAKAAGLAPAFVLARLRAMADALPRASRELVAQPDFAASPIAARIHALVERRCGTGSSS